MEINSYSKAGVDIEKGDRFADFIKNINSKSISGGIGGFAGGVEIDPSRFKQPVMLSSTDGVGTKLMVAQKLKKYDTVGIDLVAMCVNDLAVCGCFPEVFLDYIACGSLNEEILQQVVKGIVKGCEDAECILSGGETAEMPDLYHNDDFDLAGFCVGFVEKSEILPKTDKMSEGDIILGLASSGIHSNGLSLARKVIKEESWEKLITPTKIYVKDLKALTSTGKILGAAHITGGGLESNTQRVLPENLKPVFDYNWEVPEIFKLIQKEGNVETSEMKKVFNMGIGITIIVKAENAQEIIDFATSKNINLNKIGKLTNG